MKITIIGTGFVGLPMAGAMAEVGNHVMCMDTDIRKIEMLKEGKMPIYEPGLEPLIKKNTKAGRISYTSDPKVAVAHGEVLFIAVGTPPDEDGSADLQYVLAVAKNIGQYMTNYKVVVDKSTVPVGTADKVTATIAKELTKRKKKIAFDVVSNPEFMAEGRAVADFKNPDRIVVGTDSAKARKILHELYAPFNRNHERVIEMDVRSAELTKYAANALLATKISFMNDLARLAEKLGADIEAVRQGIGSDPRIGYHWIYPGPGYGGACFPKDVKAIVKTAKDYGHDLRILRMVEAVNADQKKFLFEKISTYFKKDLKGKTIAIWGLAFKANTDDMREASSRVLMEVLWKAGAKVRAFDPQAMEEAKRIYGERKDLTLCESAEEALDSADALAILTEWEIFRSPDFKGMKKQMKNPVVFDGRNMYDPEEMKKRGFLYFAIGRGEKLSDI